MNDPNLLRTEQGEGQYDHFIWLHGERYQIRAVDIQYEKDEYMPYVGYTHFRTYTGGPNRVTLDIVYCPAPPPKPKRRMTDLGLRRPK